MHELGIALQIVRIAQGAVPEDAGEAKVEAVHLNIGKLSTVVPDSLMLCFDLATKETQLEGARLVINEIPATARCRTCGHEWTIDEYVFVCPACDGGDIEMVSGRELDVESIEIKD
jgi:hydrogenase nickel incorporation protein HypA/HybF